MYAFEFDWQQLVIATLLLYSMSKQLFSIFKYYYTIDHKSNVKHCRAR